MTRIRFVSTAVAALFCAAPLAAQDAPQAAPSQTMAPTTIVAEAAPAVVAGPLAGPTERSASVGIRSNSTVAPLEAPRRDDSVGHNPAMMIVGGAALIVGAVVGGQSGTIIMIGGAVIGLIGLWNYLK